MTLRQSPATDRCRTTAAAILGPMTDSWEDLLGLADPGSKERGRIYARENRVRVTSLTDNEVLAVVEGTDDYAVRLRRTPAPQLLVV